MVSAVRGEDGFGAPEQAVSAVHRTYLEPDGKGGWRKASVQAAKLMLGQTRGGHVELASTAPCNPLVVCEGIETGLSLLSGLLDRPATVWAALSTSGMKSLRLPANPGHLLPTPDPDPAGMTAARGLAVNARALGWRVGIISPSRDGVDWNDVLLARSAAQEVA